MERFDAVYGRLPLWCQHASVTAYGAYWRWLRFGPGYRDYLRGFQTRERFSHEAWDRWQRRRLIALLDSCADVPYYTERWGRAERKGASRGRLEELPLLDKEELRADPWAFVRLTNRPRRPLVFHTSGTTGTPIATIWSAQEMRRQQALREVRSAGWAGTSFTRPRATFSGRIVVPDPESDGPYHRFNYFERQVYFSPFHLREETAPQYVEALHRHGIEWLTGYAVSYYLLAQFILELELDPPPLRAVITTSEKVTPGMREVMTAAYRCPVFEEYSTVENALFVSECPESSLHVSPDAGIVEILRPDGSPCEPGEPGEVVATCFLRNLQPLVRYRLGDEAVWETDPCPCGRRMPVIREVLGRVEDVVIGPDGRRMVRFHGIFVDQPHIREGQIIQERRDRLRVRVVPATGFSKDDEQEIVARVRQRLGPRVDVLVEVVDVIPRTVAGKLQPVVSLLDETAAERTGLAS